jgi:hypothetical protein
MSAVLRSGSRGQEMGMGTGLHILANYLLLSCAIIDDARCDPKPGNSRRADIQQISRTWTLRPAVSQRAFNRDFE